MNARRPALLVMMMGASLAFAAEVPRPGDDFYGFVHGEWLEKTEIPADRSSWGASAKLSEENNARVLKLIEGVPANPKASADARRVHAFYAAFMDEKRIEARGLGPLQPRLAQIAAVKDKPSLARLLGSLLRADVDALNATKFGTENLFGLWVDQALTDPTRYTAYLLQGGLGMPDRAYYLDDNPKMAELRQTYQAHIAAMLKLAGFDRPEQRAASVFALERKIAEAHASRADSADVQKANNPWSQSDFAKKAPGMDWGAYFKGARLSGQKDFIVWHPSAIIGASKLVASEDLDTWKDHLAFHAINHFADLLPKAVSDQRFAFYGTVLSGTPEQTVRWKRAISLLGTSMDEAVGHLYVDQYFPAASKQRVQKMVGEIVQAFSSRVEKLDWMAPATKAEAQRKLKTLYVGVGYPDHWRSYEGLTITADDALGNLDRAERFRYAQQIAKLHRKVDKTVWAMPPQIVNAVNLPMQNALNFPAGILQAPYFDPQATDARNYGAIGAIIGHEISHSFDDQGAQFDADGRLRNWWTDKDLAQFQGASKALAAQYSGYKPFPDLALNGEQVLSENLADLAGLAAALDAYKLARGGQVDEQALRDFFIGYAGSWQTKVREAALRRQVMTDGHSPARYRVSTVRNLDDWYRAFGVRPGDALYLPPEQRVHTW